MRLKTIVIIIIVLVLIVVIRQYIKTGTLPFVSSKPTTEDEQRLQDLEKRLGEVQKELNQIEVTAGTSGIADMGGYEKLTEEQAKLREEIAELKRKLGKP
jgi:peptidoglycan hydrolase CwlO-like protein